MKGKTMTEETKTEPAPDHEAAQKYANEVLQNRFPAVPNLALCYHAVLADNVRLREENVTDVGKLSDAFRILAGSIHGDVQTRMDALAKALALCGLVLTETDGG
jgi:hypothetical protein